MEAEGEEAVAGESSLRELVAKSGRVSYAIFCGGLFMLDFFRSLRDCGLEWSAKGRSDEGSDR